MRTISMPEARAVPVQLGIVFTAFGSILVADWRAGADLARRA